MERDNVYAQHILDAIAAIEEYTKGITFEDFLKDRLRRDGVVRELEIIGEAVKKLSDAFRGSHPDIPWKDIAGMRDKLIHEYFGVDFAAIWETVESDLPILKKKFLAG